LDNGSIEFTVKITERSMKFREITYTTLSKAHIERHADGTGMEEDRGIRDLPDERKGNTITCIFLVTEKELKDPDLSFYFGMPVPNWPNIDHFYAPLRNFLPPR
jgi:hypothetical protein